MAFDSRLLNGIEVLAAVVEAGSFVRAAASLGLTQSGVSRAVARLEGRVGIRLFDRTARAVALTEEGRRFYQRVKPHLTGIEDAATEAAGAAAAVRGRLRVNVDPFFMRRVLAPGLGGFLAAHPELTLEIVARDRLGDLVSDGFDVALRFGVPEPSALIARLLLETRVLTCAAPSYLAAHGRPSHPRELESGRHEAIHFIDSVTGRPFPWEFHRKRRTLRVAVPGRLTVNDAGTLLGACAAGHGIAQILALGTEDLLASGALTELFPDWPDERFPLYAFHLSRHVPPAKLRAFLDFVIGSVRGSTRRPGRE
jgi:DNA-binding transcriptional LysR family regulator